MAEVCNGNVYLTVDDDEIDKYMSKGFSLVDERTGKIIKQSIPTEIGPLKKLYSEQLEINRQLTNEVAVLRNKLESLQKVEVAAKVASTEDSASWDDWTAEEDTSKRKKATRTRK